MGLKRCGVVRFDSTNPNGGGWACVEDQAAHRINGSGALDNETLWWSNLDFDAMYKTNLNRTPYIKRTTYLNSWSGKGEVLGQDEFCQAWGLLNRDFTDAEITEALSGIFSRSMQIARSHYGLDIGAEVPRSDNLADELRMCMLPDKDKHITPEVDLALSSAYQPYVYPVRPDHAWDEDYVDVQFIVPPVHYAQEILDGIVPGAQFEFVPADKLPSPSQRLEWIMRSEQPALARIRVSNVHADFAPIVAFGNGAKSGNNRQYASHPELILLSKYADIEIDSVFLFSKYHALSGFQNLRLPEFTSLQAMTPTAEIIASNHWVGLARENPYQLEAGKPERRAIAPRATWINALDRFLMFGYALQLYRNGISVRRYGAGRITAIVPKYNYEESYLIACAVGLLAPPTIAPDIGIQRGMQDYG